MFFRNFIEKVVDLINTFYYNAYCKLNWNPRFQFAKVNPCSGYFLQE